ncbi:MAG: RIP metalloprotease RseP [Rhodocyclales bacterium]|nr:RIP metalloprotease RseP [Rhodocyclales bacterium]
MNFLFYLGAFALALGLLIVVHEAGHFAVARLCGVKVLRFSIGFGKPLVAWRFGQDRTELALAAFPLGGYVKMLDEREEEVPPDELPRAFNRQPVRKRFAIVFAGPAANFLLAIACYWALFVHGVEELRPVLGAPVAASAAAQAGFEEGELVRSVNGRVVATWQEFRWELLQRALEKESVTVAVANRRQEISHRRLDLSGVNTAELESDVLQQIGFRFFRPELPAVIGKVSPGGVAEAAGLREGDRIVAIDGEAVSHWGRVVAIVREAPGRALGVEVLRDGQRLSVRLVPAEAEDRGRRVGRIGVAVREGDFDRASLMTVVSYGPLESLRKAAVQTWETSVFSLKVFGRMITGDVSWRNLSGPVTIADYAGQSARMGLSHYVRFLALISISLGVLNLLPIPILDGGHLMYYIVEVIKGGPVSERVMEIGQQIGLALLAMLMAFAFYNDINRLISG